MFDCLLGCIRNCAGISTQKMQFHMCYQAESRRAKLGTRISGIYIDFCRV